MPPGRITRQRAVAIDNDENANVEHLPRGKSVTGNGQGHVVAEAGRRTLKAKGLTVGATTTTNHPANTRRRAALGDLSNVVKNENGNVKEGPKGAGAKAGLVSKAAQPTRVQKSSRTQSTRSILATKDKSPPGERKRQASGSGAGVHVTKKRQTSTLTVSEDNGLDEVVGSRRSRTTVAVEVQKTVKVRTSDPQLAVQAPVKPAEQPKKAAAPKAHPERGQTDLSRIPDDRSDPLMVSEYVSEIFTYLRELEVSTMANPDYMRAQSNIDWKMRGVLIDWLVEVHLRFRLLPETLFLTVNIIDRFLSNQIVHLDRLQLVGVAAMFIASKYEEEMSPHVQNFRHVADDGFTEAEILSAERFILTVIGYDLSYPSPLNFLRRISKADDFDIETRTIAKYLMEISCLDHRFIDHEPSKIAASAMYLARCFLTRGEWNDYLIHYSGYTEDELRPVLILMMNYLQRPVEHHAFYEKYASRRFMKASISLGEWAKGLDALSDDSPVRTKSQSSRKTPV